MDAHHIGDAQQLIELDELDAGDILLRARIAHHVAPEGLGDAHHARADGARTDNAEAAAFQLEADKAVFGAALAHDGVQGGDVAVHVQQQAEHQIGHGHRRVAGAIGNLDAVLATVRHVDMVVAGECIADVLQVRVLLHN